MFKRSELVWAVLLCVVLMNGVMAVPSVAHAEHHGTHHASTHVTGICAWLCAAGQGIESSSVSFDSALQLIGRTEYVYSELVVFSISSFLFFRGPPVASR
jgi:hypothetical protein